MQTVPNSFTRPSKGILLLLWLRPRDRRDRTRRAESGGRRMRRAPFVQDGLLGTAAPPSSLPMPPPPPFGLGVRSQDPPPPLFRGWLLWRGCLYATPNWSNAHGGGEDETLPSVTRCYFFLGLMLGEEVATTNWRDGCYYHHHIHRARFLFVCLFEAGISIPTLPKPHSWQVKFLTVPCPNTDVAGMGRQRRVVYQNHVRVLRGGN